MRSSRTATKSSPHSPQLEKAHAQQRRPNAAKNFLNKFILKNSLKKNKHWQHQVLSKNFSLLVGIQIGTATLEDSFTVSYKTKHALSTGSSNHVPRDLPKWVENLGPHQNLNTDVQAALVITARTWKQPRCPSGGEWINKLWYIQTMEYYSMSKRNELSSREKTKTLIWKDTCTTTFIAALFTIAKTWKQPKCPLTDEWIKKMWYVYTIEYYSVIKKNECHL